MPASPTLVGDYLSDLGEGYARSTLRRKVAAIARAHRHAGHPLDTRHPSIRDVLRGIGRTHGSPPKRAQALATEEVQRLVGTCDESLVGLRDGALLLVAFAGALRRSRRRSPWGRLDDRIAWAMELFERLDRLDLAEAARSGVAEQGRAALSSGSPGR